MTDAHCHVSVPGASRRFLCPLDDDLPAPISAGDVVFWGVHPWFLEGERTVGAVRAKLEADPVAGVGEIGLDRLRDRTISPRMRAVFVAQLELAAEFHRPVVLHGAKCWGEVVRTVRPFAGAVPAFLFHGFSRSEGLLPDLVALNGFVSVGPSVLNDHAVNYRALVAKIPSDRLLLETDARESPSAAVPPLEAIAAEVARLRGLSPADLAPLLEANATRFIAGPESHHPIENQERISLT